MPTYFTSVHKNTTVKQYNIEDKIKQEKNTHIPFALKHLFINLFRSSILFTGAISSYSFYNEDLHIISNSSVFSYSYPVIYESRAI